MVENLQPFPKIGRCRSGPGGICDIMHDPLHHKDSAVFVQLSMGIDQTFPDFAVEAFHVQFVPGDLSISVKLQMKKLTS